MNLEKFNLAEEKYTELKARLKAGEISVSQMKASLKKMMILDENGDYWMLGGKSGSWYRYNGSEWVADNPGQNEEPVKLDEPGSETVDTVSEPVAHSAHEEQQEAEEQTLREKTCINCGHSVSEHDTFCPECGHNQNLPVVAGTKPDRKFQQETILLIKSVKLTSMLFFMGGLGLIIGVILGATFGIFPILGDLIYQFPRMLQETRGKIQGGLIFGVVGGIAGFFSFSIISVFFTGLYNFLADIFGGIRFKVNL